MNKTDAGLVMVLVGIIGGVFGLAIITFIPTYFILQQNYLGAVYWYPTMVLLGKIIAVIIVPLSVYQILVNPKHYAYAGLLNIIYAVYMFIWGLDITYSIQTNMLTTQYTDMLLYQRELWYLITINFFSLSIGKSSAEAGLNERLEKKE
jgi:hypothetical protein